MQSHPGILGKGGSPERKYLTFAIVHIRARTRLDEDLSASKQLDRRAELDENGEKPNNNTDIVWDPSK